MAPSKLQEAIIRDDVKIVGMDEVGFLRFQKGSKYRCLGTSNLNSCTAVIIVSKAAAILAHIAPRPSAQNQTEATGDDHVKAKMQETAGLLKKYTTDFAKQEPNSVVAYAVYNGKVALPDQVKIIGAMLKALGLATKTAPYNVPVPKDGVNPGRGTVIIEFRDQGPIVWVEDRCIGGVSGTVPSAGSSAAGPSSRPG